MLLNCCYCPYIRTILKYVHHFANIAYIKEQYSVKPEHAEFEFSAKIPTPEQKKLLKLNKQEALLLSAHTTYCDFHGEILPYEYVETSYNSDLYTYTLSIKA